MARVIQLDDMTTVGTLAERLDMPASKLIGELFKNGVVATVNEKLDFDTASIIVAEIDPEVTLEHTPKAEVAIEPHRKSPVDSKNAKVRPPVVAVMGHVDHGKTSLLDAIRGAKVAEGEAGGITQHISAYQITHQDRLITFLDTPGHEAFSALREHGARLTDIVIIVVAADDGIKPQTEEAIRFARATNAKIIVAITKIDKEGANIERTKQQLADQNLLIEEWGGDTIVIPVSAKTKEGIDKLLDMLLLMTDVEELKADEDVPAEGLVIESHMEQGKGPVAAALVEQGILKPGAYIVAGQSYAKIRTLSDSTGKIIDQANPSTPVIITGFKVLPQFGDEFHVYASEKAARTASEAAAGANKTSTSQSGMTSSDLLKMINKQNTLTELNVIIKADVQGSLTSVVDSLKTLDNDEVATRVVGSGVGNINENDVHMAEATDAIIYGFNVQVPVNIKQTALRQKVRVRSFAVIYELLDDVKQNLSSLLAPQIVEDEIGRLVVKGIFKTTKDEIICGGEVTKGKIVSGCLAKVIRDKVTLAEVEVTGVKRGAQEVKEVLEGEMCGVQLKIDQKLTIEEGDRLEFFTRETVTRTL